MFFFKRKPIFESSIHKTITIGTSFGKKALIAGDIPQSGGEFIHMWNRVFKDTHFSSVNTFLLLGVGGGDVITAIHQYYPLGHLTGVEIDPLIIQIAKQEFSLQENRKTKIIIADAITWIATNTQRYDVIIVDLFIGLRNPPRSRTDSFLKHVKNSLKPSGTVIMNIAYNSMEDSQFNTFKNHCLATFHTCDIIFEYKYNKVIKLTL